MLKNWIQSLLMIWKMCEDDEMNKDNEQEMCGKCKWHRMDPDDDWYCGNWDSDFYMDYTDYDDGCVDYEERNRP